MATDLHTIRTAGKKEVPHGTKIIIHRGTVPATVNLEIQLPGQKALTHLGNLPIIDGVIELPLELVFFSYAREDSSTVHKLAEKLWQVSFLTWVDTKDLLPGDDWKARIEDAIERSDYVLVFLSETSVNKVGYVQRELKYALKQQQLRPSGTRYIIPIRINPCKPPRELRHMQWLDYWEDGAYEKLKKALRD